MNTKPHKIVKKAAKRISEARIQELEAENAKLKEANDHYLDLLDRAYAIISSKDTRGNNWKPEVWHAAVFKWYDDYPEESLSYMANLPKAKK